MNGIRKRREAKELSQDALARQLNVTQSAVAKWENAESLPRADMLPKLARVLGCSIDDLFDTQDDETKAG
jgi:transcriptional regulator with XRE-family HTH domain